MSEHTPTPWKIRIHPEDEDYFYIHAEMTEDHPYNGVSSGIEIMSDEGYPRKRADAAANSWNLRSSRSWGTRSSS